VNRSIRAAAIGLFGGAMAIAVATGSASALNGPPQGHSGDQSATQGNGVGQVAGAVAQSKQILPTNLNVAPSILSVGSNDGWVTQGNASSANANAQNKNHSFQGNGAVQQTWANPNPRGGSGPSGSTTGKSSWPSGNSEPQGGKNCHPQRTESPRGENPGGPDQSSTQGNGIGQVAGAAAKSTQVAPSNINVAPSILSVGSNDGGVKQGNTSSANANAQNGNSSGQGNLLGQVSGGPSGLLG
jgi:hypothetical protein